ncbi:hypothetical protein DRQ16_04270 [bacterium]|nr:MAG: hypothetical protein DRQ18_05445 [bacterium]RKZ20924.1 MAG: hypothetical protein DRQ16_04270 [bacterium]
MKRWGVLICLVFLNALLYYFFLKVSGNPLLDYNMEKELENYARTITDKLENKGDKIQIKLKNLLGSEYDPLVERFKHTLGALLIEKGLTICVNEDERDSIVEFFKRIRKKERRALKKIGGIKKLLRTGTVPTAFLNGEIKWEEQGKNFAISFTLTNIRREKKDLPPGSFYHQSYIESLKKTEENLKIASFSSLGVLGVYLVFLFVFYSMRYRVRKSILNIVSEVNTLIENKHFVAASQYLKHALRYDPENPYLHDLKTKLDALSMGNPEKAQKAWELYNQAVKYRDEGMLTRMLELSPLIREYMDYNPELKALASEIERKIKQKEAMEKALAMQKSGEIRKALALVSEVDTPEVAEIKKNLEKKIKELEREVEEAESLIKRGEIEEARRKLEAVLKEEKEFERAKTLLSFIQGDALPEYIVLRSLTGIEKIFIIPRAEVKVGRKEGDIVISSPYVSQPHAVLRVIKEGLLVEDMGSKNGTYLAGEKIKKGIAEHGDVLGFSKNITCMVSLYRSVPSGKDVERTVSTTEKKECAGAMLEGREVKWILVPREFYLEKYKLHLFVKDNVLLFQTRGGRINMEGYDVLPDECFPFVSGKMEGEDWEFKVEVKS